MTIMELLILKMQEDKHSRKVSMRIPLSRQEKFTQGSQGVIQIVHVEAWEDTKRLFPKVCFSELESTITLSHKVLCGLTRWGYSTEKMPKEHKNTTMRSAILT